MFSVSQKKVYKKCKSAKKKGGFFHYSYTKIYINVLGKKSVYFFFNQSKFCLEINYLRQYVEEWRIKLLNHTFLPIIAKLIWNKALSLKKNLWNCCIFSSLWLRKKSWNNKISILKKPAYGRQSISRPMRIVAPIPQ